MVCIDESFIIIHVYNEFALGNAAAIVVCVCPINVLTVDAVVAPVSLILLSFLSPGGTEDGLKDQHC
jgi:S-adenosylmethionine/arginine decarboxylase-like enzyme